MVRTGLDLLRGREFNSLAGRSIGVVCNQATVASDLTHIIDAILPLHRLGRLKIKVVLGPQHGLFGHTQDNMIEWEGAVDSRTDLHVHSLYGADRAPTEMMLKDVEVLVIDLPDIGSRYYTFIWTMSLCLAACERLGIPVLVLDRPNPIGANVSGTVLHPDFASFVGLRPLPTRHGMTLGEMAISFKHRFYPRVQLTVERCSGWNRSDWLDQTGLPWVMPSPNMPTLATALVYPGGCLLEGTDLSEGRGTTRPFEIFGSPKIDGWRLAESLSARNVAGASFRPVQFMPTFQKHAGALCEGCQIHVSDRMAFDPVSTYVAVLLECKRQSDCLPGWKSPPYEYEEIKLPIDILAGNDWMRQAIDRLEPIRYFEERFFEECRSFEPTRRAALLYE